ncbi:MAG TPA: preprotein translocase subunit SecY, partial [Candidatus Binataceae bacterium]|nr:preprotein translocase subunit SecY [Candidatus Binataceae bacterium]
MLEGFSNASRIPELRRRLWFTAMMLVVYRAGVAVPTPGIDGQALAAFFDAASSTLFGWVNLFSGGALERFSVFALGIMPYISVAIILDLLKVAWPYLDELYKEGEAGRRKISQYTRYGTVLLSVVQGFMIAVSLEHIQAPGGGSVVYAPGWSFRIITVLTVTAGSLFVMWIGEQVTERGIGNGISLIIMAGIVANLPHALAATLELGRTGALSPVFILAFILIAVAVIAFIVFMERAQRRIVIQYPKRQVGTRMFGGDSTHMPLKINTSGVIPPIFASSILLVPATIAGFSGGANAPGWVSWISGQLAHGQPLYMAMYAGLIVFFSYFYT